MHSLPSLSGNPLLSVIIPVYNTAPYLRRCLDSICEQTYKNLEILCVNDGSTDESADILKEYEARDSRVTVIHKENGGLSSARNVALDSAHGELITGVDSDDYLLLDTYEKIIPKMTEEVDLLQYGVEVVAPPSPWAEEKRRYYRMPAEGLVQVTAGRVYSLHDSWCCKIMRRSIIEKYHIRFPEGLWYEDFCFKYMYMCFCRTVYIFPEKLYQRTLREDSIMGQTRVGNPKSLDRFATYDAVCAFLKENGLWKTRRRLVQLIYEASIRYARAYPSELQDRAKQLQKEFVQKYGLDRLFARPSSQEAANNRPIKHERKKTDIRVSRIRRYGFCRLLPVLTIRTSKDSQIGRVRIRVKLFGFFPLLYGRGYEDRMNWRLFNFIPFWRSEKRSE